MTTTNVKKVGLIILADLNDCDITRGFCLHCLCCILTGKLMGELQVVMGELQVEVGELKAVIEEVQVVLGELQVVMGELQVAIGELQFVIFK